MPELKGRAGIAAYLREHVGEVVDKDALFEASGYQTSFARRIRELRGEFGYQIETHHDAVDLKPGQYRLAELPAEDNPPRFARGISQKMRALVLERNGSTCQMCARGVGDTFEDGQRVVLHVDHILNVDEGGTDEMSNLRTLCNRCNQGAKNIVTAPESQRWLLGKVRTANRDSQLAVYRWLHDKFKDEPL
ncbi:MAG: HNH endonuclease [bacterium]|nr:HNH endonuclease [bacterium]MDE0118109.1 HNH endonuclease [bacterium]MDE0237697.1 HNH endonuclease [bacterium]